MGGDPLTPQLIERALAGDRRSAQRLLQVLTPVIQRRIARVLLRRRAAARGRDVRQEIADLVQDVFVSLLADGGRRARAWRPERGSAEAFFGMVAEGRAINVLESRRRSPWTEEPAEARVAGQAASLESLLASRSQLRALGRRLETELAPRDWRLFQLLYLEHRSDEAARAALQLSRDALYQARRRLLGRIRRLGAALIEERRPGGSR